MDLQLEMLERQASAKTPEPDALLRAMLEILLVATEEVHEDPQISYAALDIGVHAVSGAPASFSDC